jgi:D-amino-acid dehydrogenase
MQSDLIVIGAGVVGLSRAEVEPFLGATGTLPLLRKAGALQVYETKAELDASLPGWATRAAHGIDVRHMDVEEIATRQPGLAPFSPNTSEVSHGSAHLFLP